MDEVVDSEIDFSWGGGRGIIAKSRWLSTTNQVGVFLAGPRTLSQTATGAAWLDQFGFDNRNTAASLLDAMLLLNEEQVGASIR